MSDDVKRMAKKRYDMGKPWPVDVEWMGSLFREKSQVAVKAEEKIVFCAAILPYLLCDSMDDPKVWCMVSLLTELASFYNYEGPLSGADIMQTRIDILLSVLENQMYPGFSTMNVHTATHVEMSYLWNGPLKGTDTLHCESLYHNLKTEGTGGSNRTLTIARRQTIKFSSKLVGYNYVKMLDKARSVLASSSNRVCESLLRNHKYVIMVTTINWRDDLRRQKNDLLPQWTFTDLELCDGTLNYLHEAGISVNESVMSGSDEAWRSSEEVIRNFFDSDKSQRPRISRVVEIESFSYNNQKYESLGILPSSLTLDKFQKRGFAVTYSRTRQIHLFGIMEYVGAVMDKGLYIQALVYELPIHPSNIFSNSPFHFSVDVNECKSVKPTFQLISVHRLHITDLIFRPTCALEERGMLLTTCIRQWQLFFTPEVRTE